MGQHGAAHDLHTKTLFDLGSIEYWVYGSSVCGGS